MVSLSSFNRGSPHSSLKQQVSSSSNNNGINFSPGDNADGNNGDGGYNNKSGGSTISSPMSVLEQWQQDAKGAIEDAYANYVLGDDPGESARLVLVSNPSDDLASLENSKRNNNNYPLHHQNHHQSPNHNRNHHPHSPHILLNDQNKGKGRLYSFFEQMEQTDDSPNKNKAATRRGVPDPNHLLVSHRDYYTDVNASTLYHQRRIIASNSPHNPNGLHHRTGTNTKNNPHATKFASCGVTYVEINGRAYVHAVDELSPAYKLAGIRPKDCVQYAAVLAKEWEDPLGSDFDIISSQALEREDSGQRITFEELKRVFLQGSGIINDTDYCYNGSNTPSSSQQQQSQQQNSIDGGKEQPNNCNDVVTLGPKQQKVPSTIQIGKSRGGKRRGHRGYCGGSFVPDHHDDDDDTATDNPLAPNSSNGKKKNEPRPVVLVFRRTKQRPPKFWNVWPNYRLDDECDVACQILQSLTTATATSSSSPTNNSKRRRRRRLLPHSSSMCSTTNRNNTSGLENHFDDDDDDGTAFFSEDGGHHHHGTSSATSKRLFPSSPDSKRSSIKAKNKNSNRKDAKNNNDNKADGDDDEGENADEDDDTMNEVEASTIRGMIQKAVGLAFVRSNKVVFGVSVSGGSGIVVSRLSDGTWSAPSLIGMAGMGFGIQIGMEVAHYIFVLQSKEALEHLQRGGSFTLGGNVGLAVGGMFGREAIGAASVSSALCGITPPPTPIKEDEYNYENDEEDILYYDNNNNNVSVDHVDDYDVDSKTGERILNKDRRRRRLRRLRAKKNMMMKSSCGAGITTCGGGRRSHRSSSRTSDNNSIHTSDESISSYGCHGDLSGVTDLILESGATGVAPIVAYAKSEGLYVGVSLEGSKIFTRNEMNARAYKYSSYKHKQVTARDILSGKIVSRPHEAENLYSLLHEIELTHELSCLPSLPKSKLLFPNSHSHRGITDDWTRSWNATSPPYLVNDNCASSTTGVDDGESTSMLTDITSSGRSSIGDTNSMLQLDKALMKDEIDDYHEKFQDFLFGGFTVLRISASNPKKREQRTLWLQSSTSSTTTTNTNGGGADPNNNINGSSNSFNSTNNTACSSCSVRIGFVSKLYSATAQRKHLSASIIQDVSTRNIGNGVGGGAGGGSHFGGNGAGGGGSMLSGHGGASIVSEMDGDDLTLDSALMDNQSLLTTTGTLQERVELSKKLSMDLVDVISLTVQKAPPEIRGLNREEGDRVICIESLDDTQLVFAGRNLEETRMLFCGLKILLEKETARIGIRGGQGTGMSARMRRSSLKNKKGKMSSNHNRKNVGSGYVSSDVDDTDHDPSYNDPSEYYHNHYDSSGTSSFYPLGLPEGWRTWGRVPSRSYMRAQSASTDDGYPTYAHGQLLNRDVCKNVILPLPLPLCRVLLLDSSSPVVSKWESDRGDTDFERTPWTFPPATPREMEQFQSEHQLIASGSMCGAHRTISYERYRNGIPVRLSETHIVDSDDSERLAFQVTERLPRRGFSIKVKIILSGIDNGNSCEVTVLGEIRPVGKNMSDPAAVHKALLKVMEELRNRYGTEYVGLLAGFMTVIENMPKDDTITSKIGAAPTPSSHWRTDWEEKKENENRPNSKRSSPPTSLTKTDKKPLDKTSVVKFQDVMSADLGGADEFSSKFAQDVAQERRPSNSINAKDYKAQSKSKSRSADEVDETFASSSDPVTIEVKPLPKIRLSLMPSPREEDEENLDEDGDPVMENPKKKEKKSSSKSKSSSSRSKRPSWGKKKKSSSSG